MNVRNLRKILIFSYMKLERPWVLLKKKITGNFIENNVLSGNRL